MAFTLFTTTVLSMYAAIRPSLISLLLLISLTISPLQVSNAEAASGKTSTKSSTSSVTTTSSKTINAASATINKAFTLTGNRYLTRGGKLTAKFSGRQLTVSADGKGSLSVNGYDPVYNELAPSEIIETGGFSYIRAGSGVLPESTLQALEASGFTGPYDWYQLPTVPSASRFPDQLQWFTNSMNIETALKASTKLTTKRSNTKTTYLFSYRIPASTEITEQVGTLSFVLESGRILSGTRTVILNKKSATIVSYSISDLPSFTLTAPVNSVLDFTAASKVMAENAAAAQAGAQTTEEHLGAAMRASLIVAELYGRTLPNESDIDSALEKFLAPDGMLLLRVKTAIQLTYKVGEKLLIMCGWFDRSGDPANIGFSNDGTCSSNGYGD